MNKSLRHRTVAVAVIYDEPSNSFLLWNNPRWHGYAFPMKHFEPGNGIDPAKVALSALDGREIPLSAAQATARPLDRHGECQYSEGAREYTYYDYRVFGIDLGRSLLAESLNPDLRWFTYDQLLAAESVTSSTKSIARSLVEDRRVAVAVICRAGARRCEFLLVWNKHYQFFFPSARLKDSALPAQAAVQVVRNDLGYEGAVDVVGQSEVETLQDSLRFGPHQSRFHFHVCQIKLLGIDLTAAGNDMEKSLMALPVPETATGISESSGAPWGWFTEQEMRTRSEMSPSVVAVLPTVLQLVGGG